MIFIYQIKSKDEINNLEWEGDYKNNKDETIPTFAHAWV